MVKHNEVQVAQQGMSEGTGQSWKSEIPFETLLRIRIAVTSLTGNVPAECAIVATAGILEKQRTKQLSTDEKTKWLSAPYSLG